MILFFTHSLLNYTRDMSFSDKEVIHKHMLKLTSHRFKTGIIYYKIPTLIADNLLVNGGLEVGPAFLNNSNEGVLLIDDPDNMEFTLQQYWSVTGTVKYINSEHYSVPEDKAVIELLSYMLEFMMGDANNSCLGEFKISANVRTAIQNFTM